MKRFLSPDWFALEVKGPEGELSMRALRSGAAEFTCWFDRRGWIDELIWELAGPVSKGEAFGACFHISDDLSVGALKKSATKQLIDAGRRIGLDGQQVAQQIVAKIGDLSTAAPKADGPLTYRMSEIVEKLDVIPVRGCFDGFLNDAALPANFKGWKAGRAPMNYPVVLGMMDCVPYWACAAVRGRWNRISNPVTPVLDIDKALLSMMRFETGSKLADLEYLPARGVWAPEAERLALESGISTRTVLLMKETDRIVVHCPKSAEAPAMRARRRGK